MGSRGGAGGVGGELLIAEIPLDCGVGGAGGGEGGGGEEA